MKSRDFRSTASAIVLPLILAACGAGGDSGTTASSPVTVVSPAPAPTPSSTPTPTAIAAPAPSPSPTPTPSAIAPSLASSWSNVTNLFSVQPDVPNCKTGTLKQAVRDDVLARLNAIRALHRLPAVSYAGADDEQTMQSSLMMAANAQLNHTPPNTWKCWSQTGYDGSSSSNLYGGTVSPYLVYSTEDDFLAGWLTEVNNLIADNVGHRRWMLDPFLGKISYGRVAQVLSDGSRTDAATLKVFSFTGGVATPGGIPDYVAYPYGDYPAKYFDTRALLSFSVLASKTTRGGANASVDFSKATITVTNAAGTSLAVSGSSFDNIGYGVSNNLQWKVAGLAANTSYTVTIANVIVGGAAQTYTYPFRIVG